MCRHTHRLLLLLLYLPICHRSKNIERHHQINIQCFCCSKFYDKDALLSDPVDGMILASLLGELSISLSYLRTTNLVCKSLVRSLLSTLLI